MTIVHRCRMPPVCEDSTRVPGNPNILTARGESLTAFDGRCIARLGATPDFHHGLLCISHAVLMALFLLPASVFAQWTKVPSSNVPHTSDGKPNLSAPVPRGPDGKPDLTGPWSSKDNAFLRDIAAGMEAEAVPFQPWAKALFDQRKDGSHSREDPDANCLPQGVPKVNAVAYPWKMIPSRGSIVIVYEAFNLWRQVFMDGRELRPDANPTWQGYSTGKWEGDTLVVDTRGFNGKAWLDQLGRPTTEALHVVERFRRQDFGRMEIQITIDDPKAYTRPWTVTEAVYLQSDTDLLEFICNENNRDLEHLPGERLR
jgi:hypothetical protein